MSFDFAFTPPPEPGRDECARQGQEAVAIGAAGHYAAPSGKRVDLAVEVAVSGTVDHRPEETVPLPRGGDRATRVEVVNGTSLASGREVARRGMEPLVLNFASARNPGGGFLRDARAQEESLARASALHACLLKSPMYAHHRQQDDPMYTSWAIWSPHVPVFRDDATGLLLETPWTCTFLTAAAPRADEALERDPGCASEVEAVMRSRVTRSLAIAALHGHTHLVLGAWGCGVFKNDPKVVADAYARDLEGTFAGVFDEVVFAVLDTSSERRFIRPFVESFA